MMEYGKNLYALRNHIIPNEATMRPQAEWFLVPQWLSSWELYNLSMGVGSCFYPMTHRDESHWLLENHAFPNTPFLE